MLGFSKIVKVKAVCLRPTANKFDRIDPDHRWSREVLRSLADKINPTDSKIAFADIVHGLGFLEHFDVICSSQADVILFV